MTGVAKAGTMSWRSKGRFARKDSGTVTLSRHKERTVQKIYDPFADTTVEFGKGWRDRHLGGYNSRTHETEEEELKGKKRFGHVANGLLVAGPIGAYANSKHTHRVIARRKKDVKKADGYAVTNVRYTSALLPTGAHVGDGQKLKVIGSRKSQGSGRAPLLHVTKGDVDKGLRTWAANVPTKARKARQARGMASALDRKTYAKQPSYFGKADYNLSVSHKDYTNDQKRSLKRQGTIGGGVLGGSFGAFTGATAHEATRSWRSPARHGRYAAIGGGIGAGLGALAGRESGKAQGARGYTSIDIKARSEKKKKH